MRYLTSHSQHCNGLRVRKSQFPASIPTGYEGGSCNIYLSIFSVNLLNQGLQEEIFAYVPACQPGDQQGKVVASYEE